VDDRPYGWWAGTIITIEPLTYALRDLLDLHGNLPIYLMAPSGEMLTQEYLETSVEKNSQAWWCIIICCHYEWVDERIFDLFPIKKISLWEYVISSGELASLVFIDGMVRLIPWVINTESREEDSFSIQYWRKKEYPQFSRPEVFEWVKVPEVLLSGDRKKIEHWKQSNLS
jgi:tRNA (guanine37-N1)-methyltransferase